jgi:cyclopropane-fatty-acyl-phospholipid synthase
MTLGRLDIKSRQPLAGRAFRTWAGLADRALPALKAGRLHVTLPNGAIFERIGRQDGPAASVSLRRWRALWRLAVEGEDGVANGYIEGDWTTPDLLQLFNLVMHNETAITPRNKKWLLSRAGNRLRHLLRANTRRGSRRNIAAHYDLGNDFFAAWLDRGMNYSSAIFSGNETLEEAQNRKLDRVAELLELKGGERVLEIGSGWGALAERLIGRFGVEVAGITLSSEQLDYSRQRLASHIGDARADISLLDYRDVAGRFDRIASIEMIEAVGEQYWPTYFAKLRALMRDGGITVLQAITIAESRFAAYRKRPDFIQRHIFPGGMLPTRSIIENEAARAGLRVVSHETFGQSYARTLGEWRGRFLQAWPKIVKLGFDERFKHMWEYYLTYCETGFRTGTVDVGLYKLVPVTIGTAASRGDEPR